MSKTIAVDFDGVLHTYERGWDNGTIYGELIDGARESLELLQRQGYALFVFTSRDVERVTAWLDARGFDVMADTPPYEIFWSDPNRILVTNRKLPAWLYIDDRSVRFTGSWKQTITIIRGFAGREWVTT